MFKLIVPNMVSHTDSNREPTYYKSADEGISSRIMYDSKRLLSHPSNKISGYYNSTILNEIFLNWILKKNIYSEIWVSLKIRSHLMM